MKCTSQNKNAWKETDRALIQSMQDFFSGIGYVSKPNKTSMVEFRFSCI